VRVGHRQASKSEKGHPNGDGPFLLLWILPVSIDKF